MFHRKRHHHHQPQQHSRPAVANRQAADLGRVEEIVPVGWPPVVTGPDPEMESDTHPSKIEAVLLESEKKNLRRRATSPECATVVELGSVMDHDFRMPNHSPSPVRKQVGSPVQGRSLSAAENNNASSSTSSALTGLFRRKRSPMDLSSQTFHFKASSSSPSPSAKPATPPKPQRLSATSPYARNNGGLEPKGRSLSPMPSGNILAAMVMNSIQSAVLDVGQSVSERQSRKANSTASQHQQYRAQHSDEPLADTRQIIKLKVTHTQTHSCPV